MEERKTSRLFFFFFLAFSLLDDQLFTTFFLKPLFLSISISSSSKMALVMTTRATSTVARATSGKVR